VGYYSLGWLYMIYYVIWVLFTGDIYLPIDAWPEKAEMLEAIVPFVTDSHKRSLSNHETLQHVYRIVRSNRIPITHPAPPILAPMLLPNLFATTLQHLVSQAECASSLCLLYAQPIRQGPAHAFPVDRCMNTCSVIPVAMGLGMYIVYMQTHSRPCNVYRFGSEGRRASPSPWPHCVACPPKDRNIVICYGEPVGELAALAVAYWCCKRGEVDVLHCGLLVDRLREGGIDIQQGRIGIKMVDRATSIVHQLIMG
jgi:hypothetical protein